MKKHVFLGLYALLYNIAPIQIISAIFSEEEKSASM